MADLAESSRNAIDTVDPTPYFVQYGENVWAALKGYLDESPRRGRARDREVHRSPRRRRRVHRARAFQVMQSVRLDLGYGAQVHP